jgi:hypothetical protein
MDYNKDGKINFDKLYLLQNIEKLHMVFIDDLQDKISSLNRDINESLLRHKDIIKAFEEDFCILQTNHLEKAKQIYSFFSSLNSDGILILDEWIQLLNYQQEDFIKRLNRGTSNLIVTKEEGLHSELVKIPKDTTKNIKEFCWEIADKYKSSPKQKVKDLFINNLKGKLAEESIRRYLGNMVGEVNYEIKVGGDGKVDLYLSQFPHICLQVKCRQGNPQDVEWIVSKEEIKANSAIVFVSILEKIDESQDEYNLVIVGFIPTQLIEIQAIDKKISIRDMLYINGLTHYLNKVISKSKPESTDNQFLATDETERVWHLALEKLNRPSRALLADHGILKDVNLSLSEAKIYYSKTSLVRIIQSKLPDLENAFEDIFGKKISISLWDLNTKLEVEDRDG